MRLALLSLGSKGAMTLAQFGATLLVLDQLTPSEQGYYYSFVALVAIQTLFELGLSQVLIVFLAHEARGHAESKRRRITFRARAFARASFSQFARLSLTYALAVGLGGWCFFAFARAAHEAEVVDWLVPWFTLVACYSFRLLLIWLEAVLEGMGLIADVLTVRIVAHVAWLTAFALCVTRGLQLHSLAVATAALFLSSLIAYGRHASLFLRLMRPIPAANPRPTADWRGESRSLQWRVSGSWISGYLISGTPVPLVLSLVGAAQAGQLGVALQFAAAVGVVAAAMTSPRLALASRLMANGDVEGYRNLLRRTMRSALASGGAVAVAALAVLSALQALRPEMAPQLPPLGATSLLLVAALVNCAMSCVAVFARAQKRELFALTLFGVALLTTGGTLSAQGAGGITTIAALHAAGALLFTLPSTLAAWRSLTKLRRP